MFKDSLRTAIQIRANEGRLPAKRRKNATTKDCGGGHRLLSAGYGCTTTWCRSENCSGNIKPVQQFQSYKYMYFTEVFIQAVIQIRYVAVSELYQYKTELNIH